MYYVDGEQGFSEDLVLRLVSFHVYLVGFYFLALGVHVDTRWVRDGYPKHFNGSEWV